MPPKGELKLDAKPMTTFEAEAYMRSSSLTWLIYKRATDAAADAATFTGEEALSTPVLAIYFAPPEDYYAHVKVQGESGAYWSGAEGKSTVYATMTKLASAAVGHGDEEGQHALGTTTETYDPNVEVDVTFQ